MERITLTVPELSEFLGIARITAYELVSKKEIPSFRVGRKILINRESLEKWMKEQEAKNRE